MCVCVFVCVYLCVCVCVCVCVFIACRMNKAPHHDSVGIIGDVECESGEETYPVGGTISLDTQLRAAYISCVLSTVNSTKKTSGNKV